MKALFFRRGVWGVFFQIVCAGLLGAGLLVSISLVGVHKAETAPTAITGWAWSDNIGWISLNCSNTSTCGTVNYGLSLNGSLIQGYAWSDSVGWIKFGGLSGFPTPAQQKIYLTSGTSWTVPSDWDSANNTVEVLAGGGGGAPGTPAVGGGGGGGGGAYSKKINVTLTPSTSVNIKIGSGGTASTVRRRYIF
jgi:hypothetical protein